MTAPWKPAGPAVRLVIGAALVAAAASCAASLAGDSLGDAKSKNDGAGSQSAEETVDLICLAAERPIIIRVHIWVDGQPMSEFRAAIARRLFDSFDANKNSLLEGKELAALPTQQMLAAAGRGAQSLSQAPPASLVPKQGQVTPEAWSQFLFPPAASPLASISFVSPPAEMRGPAAAMDMPATGGELAALLSAIDSDGDGRLSVAELSRVDSLFRLLDLNDDEQISRSEFVAPVDSRWAINPGQQGSGRLVTPLEQIPRTGDKSALIRRLIETFAPAPDPRAAKSSAQPGTTLRDAKAASKPPGIPLAVFAPGDDAAARKIARFDKNGDGRLDEHELADWLTRPEPEAELAVELTMLSLKDPHIKLLRSLPATSHGGASLESHSAEQVLLRLPSGPLELRADDAPRRAAARTSRYRAMFRRADQNKKGYLEASEIANLGPGLEAVDFKAMDRDHNGMVFEDEWIAYLRLRDVLAEGRLSLTISVESIDPLTQFDANHDGRLNRAELARALAAIATWDHNHDGFVTPDEVPRTLVGTFHVGPQRATASRRPRYGPMKTQSQPPPSPGPVWFQKMDRDHDGEVSLREFLGPLSVFRRLDANGDGRIDLHEAESAGK
jgi:Ca2+-binding EF-hand superfamily protein